jgi:hypothetical protein
MYVVPIVNVVICFQIEKEGELSSSSMSNHVHGSNGQVRINQDRIQSFYPKETSTTYARMCPVLPCLRLIHSATLMFVI